MNVSNAVNCSTETTLDAFLAERNNLERQIQELQERLDRLQASVRDKEEWVELASTLSAAREQVKQEGARAREANMRRYAAEHTLAKILESKEALEQQKSNSDAASALALQQLNQTKVELEILLKTKSATEFELDGVKRELNTLEPILIENRKPVGPVAETPFTELVRLHQSGIKKLDLLSEHLLSDIHTPKRRRLAPAKGESTLSPSGDNWPELIDAVHRHLFESGLVYDRQLIQSFMTLLQMNDLVILAGASGTGKTQLVRGVAEAVGAECRVIAVKPNWTSTDDLLGYFNPIHRLYAITPFLEVLVEASRPANSDRLYFVCLDEMNLARVEHYFADFLSGLEDRRAPGVRLYPEENQREAASEFSLFANRFLASDKTIDTLLRNPTEETSKVMSRIRAILHEGVTLAPVLPIPDNVRFFGAINMDDTTFHVSPKVLDRSHILRFYTSIGQSNSSSHLTPTSISPSRVLLRQSDLGKRLDYPKLDAPDGKPLNDQLNAWNSRFLVPLGIELGYRSLRQSLLFHQVARRIEPSKALLNAQEHVLAAKILPRMCFDGSKLELSPGPSAASSTRSKTEVVKAFHENAKKIFPQDSRAVAQLGRLLSNAGGSDQIFDYWA